LLPVSLPGAAGIGIPDPGTPNNLAVFGWTGSYTSDSVAWAAGGPPIIGNNIFGPATFSLTFANPLQAFLAEMNWERRAGSVVSFAAYDALGNELERAVLNNGTGVPTSNLYPVGGTYGFLRPTAEISRLDFSNGALGIRNLLIAETVGGPGVVPEPATWAMMIGGFGMVGGAMRSARRKQKVSVTYA
jgi:hypothetical protein